MSELGTLILENEDIRLVSIVDARRSLEDTAVEMRQMRKRMLLTKHLTDKQL